MACTAFTYTWHFQHFMWICQLTQSAAISAFDIFGILGWGAQCHGNITCDLIARYGDDCRVTNGAINEYGDIGCSATNVHQTNAQILFIFG